MFRLSITALAVDNSKGYALVAVNDKSRHFHVIDLYNEVISDYDCCGVTGG